MERKKVSFSAKVTPIEKVNDEFLKCKVYVCALGKNRNFSNISRDAADEALYSLYNIPVIGHLYEDENGKLHMGGHDMEMIQDAEGNYSWKSLCVPYGVLPIQNNVHYEDIVEPSGDVKTYVVADCILWTGRFPELAEAVYSEDWLFSQSMEINVNDFAPLDEDKNYTDILHYTYSALCLLGKSDDKEYNTEPCFPESKVSIAYELNEQFSALMEELKRDLSMCFSDNNNGKEGEAKMTKEMIDAILDEYGVSIEELDFEVSVDMTEEEFRLKVEEFACKKRKKCEEESSEDEESSQNDKSEEDDEEKKKDEQEEYAFTYKEKAEALSNAMPNSQYVNYWICDFDDKYAYVERSSYDVNTGDYSEVRGRYEYSYDEVSKSVSLVGEFEEMIVRWLTKDEDAAIEVMRRQYEELVSYKELRERKDKENEIDEAIEQFSDLSGNEEFDVVLANKYSYDSVDDLKNACYIIRGKFGLISKVHKKEEPSVPVGAPKTSQTLREKFHEAYGRR